MIWSDYEKIKNPLVYILVEATEVVKYPVTELIPFTVGLGSQLSGLWRTGHVFEEVYSKAIKDKDESAIRVIQFLLWSAFLESVELHEKTNKSIG